MINVNQLNTWLGKNISDICLNGYTAADLNHCAHFVSHALALSVGYTCKHATRKQNFGASLRVHEIFDRCTGHQEINQSSNSYSGLVFVSARTNFRTVAGRMTLANVPRKHMGIILGGQVWHYSNTRDMVVVQVMSQFIFHYSGQENALWCANPPAGYRALSFGQC
ncbi:MAG: hypothetical protein KF752_08135 [Pirellulaceae bacterium]|nr:hypothetical protein [Pirellulaceae bacterium]